MKKVIVITGGTSGIGKYILKKMLCQGNKVYVISKNEKKINETMNELKSYEKKVNFIKADICSEKELIDAFNFIKRVETYIDVLINNAAFDKMSDIENYNYTYFKKIVNTNLIGKFLCLKLAVPLLKKSSYPVVINIASRLATRAMKDSSAYCCSAAGIVMLTKCAALELSKYSIRVNCISPSLVLTPLSLKSYDELTIKNTAAKSTRKRLCTEQDVYNAIEFLINKKSDFINGENINVSGGLII